MIKMKKLIKNLEKITKILEKIIKKGGIPYLVGGTVRDLILDKEVKDLDIEVHNISLKDLETCLKTFGEVKLVGKKFGVFRLIKRGFEIDWSLPRKDTAGRKPTVKIDPKMTIKQALKRRDLTMNAMAIDLKNVLNNNKLEIIDPYKGQEDLEKKQLRIVDKKLFLQDPLRFFRIMQFIGRFEMLPEKNTNELCKKMELYDEITNTPLAKERIFDEIKKLFLKAKKPSLGFRWLKDIKRLKEIFPELYDLIAIKQRKDYHPEGNVFEHSMQTLDAAAILDKYKNEKEKFMIMLGSLCHDLGKAVTTDKELSCYGHDKEGVKIAKKLLKRITNDKNLIKAVCKIVRYHTNPFNLLKQKSSLKAYKRLALKLAPEITLRQLAMVNLCDVRGRNPKGNEPLSKVYEKEFTQVLKNAAKAKIENGPAKPILLGRHLLDTLKPGPKMGKILKAAYKIQIEENIDDWKKLKKLVLDKYLKNK